MDVAAWHHGARVDAQMSHDSVMLLGGLIGAVGNKIRTEAVLDVLENRVFARML